MYSLFSKLLLMELFTLIECFQRKAGNDGMTVDINKIKHVLLTFSPLGPSAPTSPSIPGGP